jgi:drug/metabolite transporter (DMT)-like permease
VLAVALGLLSGVTWGVADFFGGVASRRAAVLAVVGLSQGIGFVLALAGLLILRPDVPPASSIALGVLAGLSGVAGLVAFYRAMSVGSISLIAPVSALGAVVPLTIDLLSGNTPGRAALLGMMLALAGAALAARAPGPASTQGIGLALIAALGFGGFFSLLAASASDSVLWSLAAARGASTPIALVLALAVGGAGAFAMSRPTLGLVAAAGVLDSTANLLFAAGSQRGLVSVVAVLGSLYPVTTVALAGVLLHERLGRLQGVGAGIALAGVALIAAG